MAGVPLVGQPVSGGPGSTAPQSPPAAALSQRRSLARPRWVARCPHDRLQEPCVVLLGRECGQGPPPSVPCPGPCPWSLGANGRLLRAALLPRVCSVLFLVQAAERVGRASWKPLRGRAPRWHPQPRVGNAAPDGGDLEGVQRAAACRAAVAGLREAHSVGSPSPQPSVQLQRHPQVAPGLRHGCRGEQCHRERERLSLDVTGTHCLSLPGGPT